VVMMEESVPGLREGQKLLLECWDVSEKQIIIKTILNDVASGMLIIAILLTLSVYRKWKIEQEIEGLLWKINPDCLQVNEII
jgi:hypothetical protein